ncbi:replication restart DNA helicase PriA [Scopulibacillus darangshiensis]|uniref:Replication restart protein PriA n=1 Tax=Scopulibacillus darangshiensis TaxID=442528 RepID=A0A4R2P4N7_9BACL|nr:primosomal protein N' [Scopulibacillus darangshiensis]TCP29128.1 replication restart DNA helicase PriA [Scopulibacillus darangshiensis]
MIAKVIVDVPVSQTDRPFDYLIPDDLEPVVEPGMRVVVPFGPRKLLGFVVGKEQHSELKKIKPIESVVDHTPVLTDELLELGSWLSETALCFTVSAYLAMLPAVMKANYKKYISVADDKALQENYPGVYDFMTKQQKPVEWESIVKNQPSYLKDLQNGIKKGWLSVEQKVEDKRKEKRVKMISPADYINLHKALEDMDKRAEKQKKVLRFFLNRSQNEPAVLSELLKELGVSRPSVKGLVDKGYLIEQEVEQFRDAYARSDIKPTSALTLTDEQEEVLKPIEEDIASGHHHVYLCHGVTGSGKTEIYLQAIEKVINMGKEAIVLVPEIALTPQMVHRFKGRFGSEVAVMHSGLNKGEKYDEWRKIHTGKVRVVVGARSAVFAPFKNLGIIIIDEEHETSYKQEENPRYHARDVAIFRGTFHNCPVVLGSATPALESFARAQKGVYRLASLAKRINNQSMPEVMMIDMREEIRNGNRSMFSKVLHDKLLDRLDKSEQSVLFLNRRGYSTFVMCRDCGHVIQCPHCDISLTYHRRHAELKCHYCGYQESLPNSCPSCQSEHIRYFGSGTQKVEEALTRMIPEARVLRMDVDTTRRKGSHEKLLKAFGDGKADILLGTQMIAKGLDFPNVTLVGVLAADTMLHLPDFRASEKTFQLLTQVSGRAGRHEKKGEVVVQSYTPDHYAIVHAGNHDYNGFYNQEMRERQSHRYPPYYFLALVTVSHTEFPKVVDVTESITNVLKQSLTQTAQILGPVAPPIPRIKDRYRYQCMIKYKNEPNLLNVLNKIQSHYQEAFTKDNLHISIDVNPFILM